MHAACYVLLFAIFFLELFLMDVWAETHTPFPSSHRRLHNVMGLMGGWDYFQIICSPRDGDACVHRPTGP